MHKSAFKSLRTIPKNPENKPIVGLTGSIAQGIGDVKHIIATSKLLSTTHAIVFQILIEADDDKDEYPTSPKKIQKIQKIITLLVEEQLIANQKYIGTTTHDLLKQVYLLNPHMHLFDTIDPEIFRNVYGGDRFPYVKYWLQVSQALNITNLFHVQNFIHLTEYGCFDHQDPTALTMGIGTWEFKEHKVRGIGIFVEDKFAQSSDLKHTAALKAIKNSDFKKVLHSFHPITNDYQQILAKTLVVPGYWGTESTNLEILLLAVCKSALLKESNYTNILVVVNYFSAVYSINQFLRHGYNINIIKKNHKRNTLEIVQKARCQSAKKNLNIVIGISFDKADYEHLLNIAQLFIICSGDNSWSDACSRGKIPLFEVKEWKREFLLAMAEFTHKQQNNLITDFLRALFNISIACDKLCMLAASGDEDINDLDTIGRIYSHELSPILTQELELDWYLFCIYIFKNHNVYKTLPYELDKMVSALNSTNTDFSQQLTQTTKKTMAVNKKRKLETKPEKLHEQKNPLSVFWRIPDKTQRKTLASTLDLTLLVQNIRGI